MVEWVGWWVGVRFLGVVLAKKSGTAQAHINSLTGPNTNPDATKKRLTPLLIKKKLSNLLKRSKGF